MKKVYLFAGAFVLAGLLGSGIANAQSKLGYSAKVLAAESKTIVPDADGNSSDALREVPRVNILIGLAKGATAADLNVESLTVNTELRTVVTASIDADKLEALAALKAVTYVELAEEAEADMMYVRQKAQTGISTVHRNIDGPTDTGTDAGLGKAFLGKGVITSLFDSGLDPNHLNFRTGDNYAETRVKALYRYTGSDGTPSQSLETADEIKAFTTDDKTNNHGTHVLGIMAGSYNGNGYFSEYTFYKTYDTDNKIYEVEDSLCYHDNVNVDTYTNAKFTSAKNKPVPFYGVAPQSEIMIGCGPLYTDNMLDMAKKVRDRAKAEGNPAVINFSIGNTTGPKDGSTLFNQALGEVGEDILISMSSSNDGDELGWITKEFTATDNSFKTFLSSNEDSSKEIVGNLSSGRYEFWGNDSKPFTVTIFRYNVNNGERVDLLTIDGPKSKTIRLIPVNFTATSTEIEYVRSEAWEEAFGGYVTFYATVNPLNNRYNLIASFSSSHELRGKDTTHPIDNMDSHLCLGVEVKGEAGQKVWANGKPGNGTIFTSGHYYNNGSKIVYAKADGFTNGDSDNSVNNLACGPNVFVVGSYVNRTKYGYLKDMYKDRTKSAGGLVQSAVIPQDIASSSAYATDLIDGRKLPHIAMPGANVISSNNGYYINKSLSSTSTSSKAPHRQTAVAEDSEGNEHFWVVMSGTSMSSPAFAGSCALFLEADPTLKWDALNDILKTTCRKDMFTEDKPERFGYGKVDVYSTIKEIIRRAAVAPVYDVEDKLFVKIENGNINVFMGDTDEYTASVYNLNGVKVASESGVGEMNLPTSNLAKGVYIVNVNNAKINKSTKVVVR